MSLDDILKCIKELGMSAVFGGAFIWLCIYLVKHTVTNLSTVVNNLAITVSKVQDSLVKHEEKADERGKYVREEHKQMIETLGRINGYKRQ